MVSKNDVKILVCKSYEQVHLLFEYVEKNENIKQK